MIAMALLLVAPCVGRPAHADGQASFRILGSSQLSCPDSPAPSLEWAARLSLDRGALAIRRCGPEWRGFIQLAPGARWLLAVGNLAVEWAAGGLRSADEAFDRFARTGVGPVSRGVLRAPGTISWSRAPTRGIAVAAPFGPLGLAAWAAQGTRGAGVQAGPIAIAGETSAESGTPAGISLAARVPGVCLLEAVGRGGRTPRLTAVAARWRTMDRTGWGSIEGAFRLRAASEASLSGSEDGWDVRWTPSTDAKLRPSLSARTVRHESGGPLPELDRRLGLVITRLQGSSTIGASVIAEESERCQTQPDDPDRRVLLRTRRLVTDVHGRLCVGPTLTLGLRYRQSGLEAAVDPAGEPSGFPDVEDEPTSDAWDRGRGSALLGDLEWRSTRGVRIGLSIAAAADAQGPATWVPAHRPLDLPRWVLLPTASWLGEAWVGTCWRVIRLEAVGCLRSAGVSDTGPRLTLLGGLELRLN
jgi:hypothetical protein